MHDALGAVKAPLLENTGIVQHFRLDVLDQRAAVLAGTLNRSQKLSDQSLKDELGCDTFG